MSVFRRMLILPALAGLALAAMSLALGVGPASAQYYGGYGSGAVSLTCNGNWPYSGSSCTVTPSFSVPPGGSFTVNLPDGSVATVTCPSGCFAGATYTLTPALMNAYSTYSTPQSIYPGGACVYGSYPTVYGCTSATVVFTLPYSYNYSPPVYIQPFPYFPTCRAWWCFNNGNCNNWWCRNNCNNWWCRDHDDCVHVPVTAAVMTSGASWRCYAHCPQR
jgi:hypothetical protein